MSGATEELTRAGETPGAGMEERSTEIYTELCVICDTELCEDHSCSGKTHWILTASFKTFVVI